MALCDAGKRVLLVSTDPASNVGQVFATTIGNRVTTMAAVPGLSALEIDPPAAAKAYRERIVGPVRGKLPEGVVRSIEEQLSGACTTEIAAFDEFTSPMMQLQDPKQTKVLIVTLPEPTPVQEAANLQADLRRAGIEPWGWLINHSLQQAAVSSPLLQLRAERQLPHIEAVEQQHASRYAVVPLLAEEPVGADALRRLCQPH